MGVVIALSALLAVVHLVSSPGQPAVLRPFPEPQLKQLPQFGGQHADRLLWGTYRPGYYFGEGATSVACILVSIPQHACTRRAPVHCWQRQCIYPWLTFALLFSLGGPPAGMRMRRPQSLLVGLMWVDPEREDSLYSIRCV